jgi:hypothetical protein
MPDPILTSFLRRQREEGATLAQASELLDLLPIGGTDDRYVAQFRCLGLVRLASGEIVESNRFRAGICFPADYLRTADPYRVVTWLGPRNVWHPNISAEAPSICVGRCAPGTGLVDILHQVFEIITWNKVTMREDDALNRAACQWARHHQDRFPVDRRPLRRAAAPALTGSMRDLRGGDGKAR